MSLRRVSMAVAVVCGLGVWGFANSDAEPVRAQSAEADEDDENTHDEAAARYRANQSRHWRHVAVGSATAH